VDIIISEWMGFCLLYEGMLDSVIYARDKFLKKDGFMFPERAKIYIAGINDYQMKSRMDGFYTDGRQNGYGITMSALKKRLDEYVYVEKIMPEQIVTTACKVFDVDLNTCTVQDL